MPRGRNCFFILLIFLLAACGDAELKKIEAISSKKILLNKDRTLGADVTYSDSAVVKAKGYAPILDRITTNSGAIYQEMPAGVKIDFFQQEVIQGSITSDYAIRRNSERITVFKKNVVVTYPDGKYTCEELTWDENKKVYTSPSGNYTKADGTTLNATNFVASQDFKTITMEQASAEIYTKGNQF